MRSGLCYFFLDADFLRGTLAPARRASDSPIAIACLRLLTFLPDRPLFSVPFFFSCIARLTLLCAFFPYFAIAPLLVGVWISLPCSGQPVSARIAARTDVGTAALTLLHSLP